MAGLRYFLLLFSVFLILGCEDKTSQSKKSIKETTEKKVDSTPVDKTKSQNEKLKMKIGSIIESQADLKPFLYAYDKKNPETRVRMKTEFGDVEFELFKNTPLHRANFILLVKQNYFKNTMIHRVSPGFVVQGGNSDGYETPNKRLRIGNYLLPNEASPTHPHDRGVLSAAKYLEQNISDASSPFEFFIVVDPNGAHHLDGEHTVFGRVTKGMNVIDELNKLEVDKNEWPIKNVYIDMELMD